MKTLILSDLHANIDALEAIWRREQDSDVIICAGDLVDIGPRPKEVIAWVQQHQALCVRGNHDTYLIDYCDANGKIDSANMNAENWLQHHFEIIDDTEIEFLRRLPATQELEIDSVLFGVTHAYKGYDVIIGPYAFDKFLSEKFTTGSINTLIFVHTHRQAICHVSKHQSWVNPGSVSYRSYLEPGNPFTGAEYMTLIDGNFEFKHLNYDTSRMNKEIQQLQQRLNPTTIRMGLDRFPAL